MECNKDEALRAKKIAERRLEKKDFAGAKKIALKAKALYSGLDGISQMLTILDVYVAAEHKIGGETDWYGVLGANPSDDDETLRKQYRKLALVLHPDKNKCVGADGAFKLLSEAWILLSDQGKRLLYDQRRRSRGFQQKGQMHARAPSAPSRENGIFGFARGVASFPNAQKGDANVPSAATLPSHLRSDTFWTICNRCKMHYEYLRQYMNTMLLCPTCNVAFMASKTAPPYHYYKSSNQVSQQRPKTSNDCIPTRDVPVSQKSGPGQAGPNSFPHSRSTSVGSGVPSAAAEFPNVDQQAHEKFKRTYAESHSSAGLRRYVKKRKLGDDGSRQGINNNVGQGNGGFGAASGSPAGSKVYGSSGTFHWPDSTRELNPVEVRKLLIERARKEILDKLNILGAQMTTKALNKEDMSRGNKQVGHRSNANYKGHNQNGNNQSSDTILSDQLGKDQLISCSVDKSSDEDPGVDTMTVPDPDFYDFDQDRSESSFGDNEVWAAYDDDDGMPRFYALISKVVSRKPFKLRISWLNSRTNTEFSTMDWVASGFYKTCGEFRVGRYETCKSINAFSHKVNWSKNTRGSILIFPQKGDVWALFKNWSSDWNENTPSEVIHKYEMVTVLDEYSEEQGIYVAPLEKVAGFKTVCRPNMDPVVIKRIPKEEMLRFSHRVPYHLLTGKEAQNAPKGCLELDPAATPLELLQVITESSDAPVVPNPNQTTPEVLMKIH